MNKTISAPIFSLHKSCHILLGIAGVFFLLIQCSTPTMLVNKEQNTGDLFFNRYDYPEAARHYTLMIEASRKLGIYRNLTMESDVHRKIANCYEMTGDYENALSQIRYSIELDSTDKNLLGLIEDYRQEGKIFIYIGLHRNGILSLEKSLRLSEGMDQSLKDINRLSVADTYLALGQLYAVLGRFAESQDYTGRSLQVFRQTGDRIGEMESYLTMGSVFSDIGDNPAAQNLINMSIEIANELNMGTARHNQILASILVSSGRYEDAIRCQEMALQDAYKIGIKGQIIWAIIGMGDIYRGLGDTKRAERYYHRAQQVKDTTGMKAGNLEASLGLRLGDVLSSSKYFSTEKSLTGGGISYLRLAEMMIVDNKPDSALLYTRESERTFVASGNKQGIINAKLLKGRLLIEKGDYQAAKRALDSASVAVDYPESVWQAHFHTGRMYENLNQDLSAIESYKNAIEVIEKIRGNLTVDEFKSLFFNSKRDVYDKLINLLIKNNKPVEAFQFSEQARARAFYDMLANKKIGFGGSVPGDLISQEQEKRMEIQKLFKLLQSGSSGSWETGEKRSGEMGIVRNSLAQAQEEHGELIQKIKLSNPAYAEILAVKPAELSELQLRIDLETAVIAYWISEKDTKIWLVTHSQIISKSIQKGKTELESLVEKARKSIQSNSSEDVYSGMNDLYKVLIAPVEEYLPGISDLIIIPNGSLHFLPFQALINTKGEFMVMNYNIVYSPSASVFIICNDRMTKTGSKFMGMALSDISVDNNVGLPGTEDELKRILPLFPDNISAIGQQSSETFFKDKAADCNYIHFATHGIYNYNQPLYSYLLFPPSEKDDGRLNVYEVFETILNARLITLSACETGLGNINSGDEITGLSRAFLFAGSSSVIVSLWSVADYPTALLMSNFYRLMKDHTLQEAMTLAQREVMKLYKQPLYWSPFIIIGNGNLSAN